MFEHPPANSSWGGEDRLSLHPAVTDKRLLSESKTSTNEIKTDAGERKCLVNSLGQKAL